ncbi:MAG TPA: DNA starvation/stationary phase protection protein [bacterium]|nr:DNA starvation/stationary phase protection protein [bacterium]
MSKKKTETSAINIGLDDAQREAIGAGLSRLLADSYSLFLMTHNFHWNVVGPQFRSLHLMFEEQYTELFTGVDEIAERIRSLGIAAPGTFKKFESLASFAIPEDAMGAGEMLVALVQAQEAVVRTARATLPVADEANDQPTMDLLTRRMEIHEKNAWMLRAMTQE